MTPLRVHKRRELDQAWDRFVGGGDIDNRKVRPLVRESWIRSREHGINPSMKCAPTAVCVEDIDGLRMANDAFRVGDAVLRRLFEVAGHPQLIASLLDDQARILSLYVGGPITDRCMEINAVPGSAWGERDVGTQGGTTLAVGQPIHLVAGEHYCATWKEVETIAEPICDPTTKRLVGFISLDFFATTGGSNAKMLARWARSNIEQGLRELALADRVYLLERYCQHESRFPSEAVLALDRGSGIIAASPSVGDLIGRPAAQLMNSPFSTVLRGEADPDENGEWSFFRPAPNGASVQIRVLPVKREDRVAGKIVALQVHRLSAKRVSPARWQAVYTFDDLVGESAALHAAVRKARSAAATDFAALLCGESGTGKELLAHAIHSSSMRRSGPFVPVNCGAVSEELIAAELFGYVEGAFTGAARGGSQGKIELASGGTLFLDEIASMSARMQVALLRVLEDGLVVPVGGMQPKQVDIRVIGAMNQDPEEAVADGTLRADLYYRLSSHLIAVPPLRERVDDVPLLAGRILRQVAPDRALAPEALEALRRYSWPGNIRELKNVLLQALGSAAEETIRLADLPLAVRAAGSHVIRDDGAPLARAERTSIVQTIEDTGGRLGEAASRLGIHRTTLYRKMRRHGIVVRSKYEPGDQEP